MDVAEGKPALLVGVLPSLSFPWQLEGLRLHADLPGVDTLCPDAHCLAVRRDCGGGPMGERLDAHPLDQRLGVRILHVHRHGRDADDD